MSTGLGGLLWLKRQAVPGWTERRGSTTGRSGGKPERSIRTAEEGSVPGEAGSKGVYTEDRWKERPIGIPTLEDKIVQRATVEVLSAIYEKDFLGSRMVFDPKGVRICSNALAVGIMRRKVSWVLDADIRSFFDTLSHEWLVKFVEHRIADRRIVRLIQKWLNAGVLEEGKRIRKEEGTVQGGSISPLSRTSIFIMYSTCGYTGGADTGKRRRDRCALC